MGSLCRSFFMFLFILLIALVQTRFWHFVAFGSFFPCFDVVSLHFLLVACHSHFPSVLDLCVFFSCCCPDCPGFFYCEDKIAHMCDAHGGVTHKNAPCQRPLKTRNGKDCMSMITIHHHPALPPGETAGAQSALIKWQITHCKTP